MRCSWAVRLPLRILGKVARQSRWLILRANRTESEPAYPEGFSLLRVTGSAAVAYQDLAEEAMRSAGEPDGLVTQRFAHGDVFFGWMVEGRVVSFGWVTYRNRVVGSVRLAEAPGRAFLYNFHTLEAYRGRGLYPALLLAMRSILGRESMNEFIIDVNVRNSASARGIEKAGFTPAARVALITLFTRWRCPFRRTVLAPTAASLF